MAGNGALDLSIRIMGKVDPSLAKTINQVKGLTGSLADEMRGTNSLAASAANALGVVGKAGLALGAALTGTVAVGIQKATSEAAKLEAQMAPVMRYVDGLADSSGKASDKIAENGKAFAQNYADMENYIQRLSMDIPRTTDQITTMSAALGQSGKNVDDQLTSGILRDTAMAATAMDLSDEDAGNYMAKWEVSFTKKDENGNKVNYSHDDVMQLMNQINYVAANTATTAPELAKAVNDSASVGQLAGVNPKVTIALADAMLATGVDASKVATSLKRDYINLTKGSSASTTEQKMWRELGFTAEGVASSMQKDGLGTLQSIFEAIGNMPDDRKMAAINTLFKSWALEGDAKIVNNPEAMQRALDLVNDPEAANSMEREFAINSGTQESLSLMRDNAKTVLMQDIGEKFLPAQKELTRIQLDFYKEIDESLPDLSNLVNSILPLIRAAVTGIGDAAKAALPWIQKGIDYTAEHGPEVAGAIAAIVAALGAMSFAPTAYSAGSTLLNTVGSIVIGGKPSGAPGGTFGGITIGNLLGLLSPVSLFQNTVSGGKSLWDNKSNILKSAKMGAWMANSSGQGGIAGRLSSFAGSVLGVLNQDALTSGKKKPMQAVANKIYGVTGYINNVANIPTNAMNAMIAAANPAGTATATIGNVLGAGAGAVFGKNGLNLTGGIWTVAGKLGGGFMSLLGTFGPIITGLGTMVAVVSLLGDHFEDVRNIVEAVFGKGGLAVFDEFTGKITGIGDTVKQVFRMLSTPEGLQNIQEKLSGFSIGGLNLGDVFGAMTPAIQTVMPLIQSFAGVFSQIVDLGVNHIKPVLTEIFGFVINKGIPAVIPLLSTVVSLVGTTLVNAIKVAVDLVGKVLPVVEPVILGIIGFLKQVATIGVKAVNFIIGALNKIKLTIPETLFGIPVSVIGGKSFGFNLSPVSVPAFANGGMTHGPSIAGEAGPEAVISFRRGVREKNIDTWLTAGKMLGVGLGDLLGLPGRKPKMFADGGFTEKDSNLIDFRKAQRQQYFNQIAQSVDAVFPSVAASMVLGSDAGVAFSRITEFANYAVDGLEAVAAMQAPAVTDDQSKAVQTVNTGIGKVVSGAQTILANENAQKVIRFIRKADMEKAQLEYAANPDNYDLGNVDFFPTVYGSGVSEQDLSALADLQNYRQNIVELPSIGGIDNAPGGSSGSTGGGGSTSFQRTYTSSSGNTYVYAPNFTVYGGMNTEDLRALLEDGYEKFCEYIERYEREMRRKNYGT